MKQKYFMKQPENNISVVEQYCIEYNKIYEEDSWGKLSGTHPKSPVIGTQVRKWSHLPTN